MSELFLLGLTGSIGMGKTTTAEMFRDALIAVWDADAAVHELYTSDTDTIEKIYDIAPAAVSGEGVDRKRLGNILQADKDLFPKLEAIVHPAIRAHRAAFIEACKTTGQKMAVVDIPLLYETKADEWLDAVLVVTTDADTQRERVMARGGMTEDIFQMILSRQTPDADKRARANYVIETKSMEHVRDEVHSLIVKLIGALPDA
jgi:dephospho-CoA kinase